MLHEVLCLFCQPPKRGAADAEPSGSRALIAVFLVQNKLHNIFFDGVERLVQIERCLVRACEIHTAAVFGAQNGHDGSFTQDSAAGERGGLRNDAFELCIVSRPGELLQARQCFRLNFADIATGVELETAQIEIDELRDPLPAFTQRWNADDGAAAPLN